MLETFAVLIGCWWMTGCGSEVAPYPLINIVQTKDVIFIGDSITYHWAADPTFMAHANWINKGINGQTSMLIAQRFFTDVIAHYPKTVHILVGTNDVYPGWQSCTEPAYGLIVQNGTCSNILYMVQTAQHYGIKVVLGTIPPWGCSTDPYCGESVADETASRYQRIDDLNQFIKAFGVRHGITVVDYHTMMQDQTALHYAQGLTEDGVHPSLQAYAKMDNPAAAAVE